MTERAPVTLPRLAEMKEAGEPIVMVTAYDYPSARVAEEAGVDLALVGDTAAMVVLGYPGTEAVSMDEMIMLGKAVRRGVKTPLMVGDMPMGSYESSNELAVQSAQRLVKETGCQVVKLEAGGIAVERARAIVRSGIPVMGHVGLTPQSINTIGSFRAQGREESDWGRIEDDALAVAQAGAFSMVIEAVAEPLARKLTGTVPIPTIGIGASVACDGQVLVLEDMLGLSPRVPKFVKRYGDLGPGIEKAIASYAAEVRARSFPGPEHTYPMKGKKP